MSTETKQLKAGSPCWFEIPAEDVSRARKFYGDVFNWTFQPGSPDYPEDALAMFNYPDERLSTFAGGIVQYEKEKMMQGKGATLMYLWSEDIEATMEKIEKAGGKAVDEKAPEGKMGFMQHFEDSEGNVLGIYQARKD